MRYADNAPQEHRLYFELAGRLERREPVAVATIVRVWGSTPREVGAKMLIDPGGAIAGTVGGGCGEAEVWQEARGVLEDGRPRQVHVDLTEGPESDDGKVCGGRFDVLVDLWAPENPHLRSLARSLLEGLEQRRTVAVVTVLAPPGRPSRSSPAPSAPNTTTPGTRLLYLEGGRLQGTLGREDLDQELLARLPGRSHHRVESLPGVEVFVEVLEAPPQLVIAGAGHIARPLTRMAALCGFEVTVMDDRAAFADPRWFPQASAVVCKPFLEAFTELTVTPRTHVVLVTRGHKHDEECLRQLIGSQPAYLGMIGSRRRTRAVFEDLEREGVPPEWLDLVHAPIGLDIGAETPEEIAVAILAEMIQVRRGGRAPSLGLRGQDKSRIPRDPGDKHTP